MTANACDFCQRPMCEDDGALCEWCVAEIVEARGAEWDEVVAS